jgi:hypothetical protein
MGLESRIERAYRPQEQPKLIQFRRTLLMIRERLQTVDPNTSPTQPEIPDPFDPATLRLNPSFLETATVKKIVTTVPSRRPNPQDFVRVRPEPEFYENFAMICLKEDQEDYLVRPELVHDLSGEIVYKTVYTAINRQGVIFLWPVRLPRADGRIDGWARSDREAAEMGMSHWIRVRANRSLGAYEIFRAESEMADPVWPELSFHDLIKIAYRDRMITSLDHPVVKRLRGQA